ncbi:hypothetical protein O6H91_09G037300 [Diphasiastrum complanatum]|nr:hypothetical protein O6H91_09G037300 [Diphasiastrum complanatum]
MLISLISILGCFNIRTLVCAPTNIAICDIAEKFIRFFDEASPTEEIQFSHCCQGLSSIKPLQMGDVLLVGSEDRLSLDGDPTLNNIFLEFRAQSLLDVLFILDDYKSTVNMIVQFMTSALNEYEKYMSNFHSGKKGYHPLKLAQFCREKIQRLMPKLMDLCWTMSNHLPTKLLPPDKLHQIVQVATFARIFLEFAEMEFSEEEASKCYSHFKPKKAYDCPYQSVTPDGSVKDMFSIALFVDYRKRLVTILKSILDFISHLKISKNEQQLKKKCLENAHIVFSTVSSAGRPSIKDSGPFQVLVIDEASQLVEAETAIVTQMDGLRRAILVGDQKQLPATVFSELAKRCNYDRSLFERLVTLKHPHDLLNIQYRMYPAISSFPSRYFYDGQVKDGYYVTSQSCKELQQTLFGPYVFIDTRDGREEKDGGCDKSWRKSC